MLSKEVHEQNVENFNYLCRLAEVATFIIHYSVNFKTDVYKGFINSNMIKK